MTIDDYQKEGAEFLAKRNFALLADEMGLGKTAQAIIAADMIGAQRILVICPAVARVNWKREFYEFSIFDRDFTVCFGNGDRPAHNTIVSYEYATENYSRLMEMQWDLIIIDESHFIKEPTSKRTIAIYGKNGIIRATKRLWALSGTPAPNHAGELWPIVFTFGFTNLSYEDWVRKFCKHRTEYYYGKERVRIWGTLDSAAPLLRHILSKFSLRRRKSEVLKNLPPISYSDLYLEDRELPVTVEYDRQKFINEGRVLDEALSYSLNDDQASLVLEGLANSVSTLRKINGLKKVSSIIELVTQELNDGLYNKIIIFAVHRDVIEALKEGLKQFNPAVINGGVSHKVRQDGIDRFQNDYNCKVFIGQIIAAGTAITLTASNQVLMLEADWTPGNNAQAIMRAHRRGQTSPVFVRFAMLDNSIDTKVTKVYRRKAQELALIFDEQNTQGEMNEINN